MIDLYNKYKDQGFEILFFPSKQFGSHKDTEGNKIPGQEPGTIAEVQEAYRKEFMISWPIMDFVTCNGPDTSDVYKFLRSAELKNQNSTKNAIEWNFGKFIVGRNGQVIKRYGPAVSPESFDCDEKIVQWLKEE
jgi:glutathione peroxidase